MMRALIELFHSWNICSISLTSDIQQEVKHWSLSSLFSQGLEKFTI